MIAMRRMVSTASPARTIGRRGLTGACAAFLAACAARPLPVLSRPSPAGPVSGHFVMAGGVRLPYRLYPADGVAVPRAVMLALHGFNDSRDAFEYAAPAFNRAGIALYAPDQRGFGAAPQRGFWPGSRALVADAATMAMAVQTRHPATPLYLLGESMGGAVLMCLATSPHAPPVAGYVLVAPAVWGRAEMNPLIRGTLWLSSTLAPGWRLTGSAAHITASDNLDALIRLSTDPLTIRRTRLDTTRGLVDLMDQALAASRDFAQPALFLYGGKDELIPPHAMLHAWRQLEARHDPQIRLAYYPDAYHLLLRDHARAAPIGDILAWIAAPSAPLPSGAGAAAAAWLAGRRG